MTERIRNWVDEEGEAAAQELADWYASEEGDEDD